MNQVPLGEISEIKSGFAFKSEDYTSEGIRLVRIGNLNGTGLSFNEDSICVPTERVDLAKEFLLKTNDVLIAMSGATTGKVAIVKESDLPCLLNQRVGRFTVKKDKLDPEYLFYFLSDDKVKEKILKVSGGSAQPNVSPTQLKEFKIPLPDLKTQQEIAQVLEQADKARQQRKAANALTDEFLQSSFLSLFGDPVKNEKGWEVKTIGELIEFMTSGSRGWAEYYSEKGDLFLRINNVYQGKLKLNDVVYVDAPDTAEAERTEVKPGDVLFSITADLGRTALIPEGFPRAFINQHLAILRFNQKIISPQFVSFYFSTKSGRSQIVSKGGVKLGLNFDDIRNLKIYIPPLSLQQQFAAIVAQAETLRKKQQENEQELEQLFQSLLQKYFG